MHALRAPGMRVIATPEALDAAIWRDSGPGPDDFEPLVLRFAPDEAFAVGATGASVPDPDAIIVGEAGFVALMFPAEEFVGRVVPHIEWPPPRTRPAFAQGTIAGVPAKLYLDPTGAATIFVLAAYVDDLLDRLPVAG
ncbi:MAG: hypothetical protein ACRDIL_18415 [Candidatus Limnocylindrales bacterium]